MVANVPVACAVAEIKILPLAYEPKAEERYLPEPLHLAAIAQLPRVSGSSSFFDEGLGIIKVTTIFYLQHVKPTQYATNI